MMERQESGLGLGAFAKKVDLFFLLFPAMAIAMAIDDVKVSGRSCCSSLPGNCCSGALSIQQASMLSSIDYIEGHFLPRVLCTNNHSPSPSVRMGGVSTVAYPRSF